MTEVKRPGIINILLFNFGMVLLVFACGIVFILLTVLVTYFLIQHLSPTAASVTLFLSAAIIFSLITSFKEWRGLRGERR